VVNQAELSRQLAHSWQEIAESLVTKTLAEDPLFSPAITSIDDLEVGIKLTGEVINQTDYGYFVDVGIQENGLLHKSKIAPGKEPEPGQLINVTVININHEKQQFSLATKVHKSGQKKPNKSAKLRSPSNSAMADALKAAMTKNH
jgi:transcriptional accessory protein Tex/SPT6